MYWAIKTFRTFRCKNTFVMPINSVFSGTRYSVSSSVLRQNNTDNTECSQRPSRFDKAFPSNKKPFHRNNSFAQKEMIRTMVFLLSMAIISPSIARQQPPFGNYSDDWWYLAVPARSFPGCTSHSNQRNCEPAVKRDDYTYTPGIGAHKVHSKLATWNEARQICKDEGGHLAIINSVAEANILGTLLDRAEPEKLYAFIGFHDWFQQSQYVTIHDQSLAEAGFTQWSPGEPNNQPGGGERCGCVYKPGALCDFFCNTKWVFICEIPLK